VGVGWNERYGVVIRQKLYDGVVGVGSCCDKPSYILTTNTNI
jgi:hypothetical protein